MTLLAHQLPLLSLSDCSLANLRLNPLGLFIFQEAAHVQMHCHASDSAGGPEQDCARSHIEQFLLCIVDLYLLENIELLLRRGVAPLPTAEKSHKIKTVSPRASI